VFFNAFSIQKFKEAEFFTRTDRFLLLEFSIQKNQRGRIFQRTDMSFKTAQKGKEKYQKLTDF